ncbi:hypothetical protein ABT324_22210 [Saccharopolyspora sp. NPDC000359]|uniref:hypothetical protein n=1 Tax=Saccharopolyspora sp. NPDC000359 TaxID=3154251 RepID=UPI00332DFF8B
MSEGDGDQVQLDATDQAYMQHRMTSGGLQGLFPAHQVGAIAESFARAESKAALAQSQAAGGSMMIDPDQVDNLARFFREEAQNMLDRRDAVAELALVNPAGGDPVSTQVAPVYSQVAAGGGGGYLENYEKLAEFFFATAEKLTESAGLQRTNDQNSAESIGGGSLA